MFKNISIGFSVNPEITLSVSENAGQKGYLNNLEINLSGSSTNVATCLKNMGYNTNLLVPVEKGGSDLSKIMDIALDKCGLNHTKMNLLSKSSVAVFPVNEIGDSKIYGKKGVIEDDFPLIQKAKSDIDLLTPGWRIATGVDKNFFELTEHFFSKEENFSRRILGPHHTVCDNPLIMERLLRKSDMLILNKYEFSKMNSSLREVHNLGVSLVIITDGENGGMFSFLNRNNIARVGKWDSVLPSEGPVYTIGAGDWFHGAFLSYLFKEVSSVKKPTFKLIKQACNFAAKVASKKIKIQGGSSGPTFEELK